MRSLKLTIFEFDNSENRVFNAIYISKEIHFISENGITDYKKLNDYVEKLVPIKPYLGHDLKIYPILKVNEIWNI